MIENIERSERTDIEKNVMRRVHTIWMLRSVFSEVTVCCLLLPLALWGIGTQVWVAHVVQNAPTDIIDLPHFYMSAFTNTDLLVQALSLLALVSLLYLARETARFATHLATSVAV